MGGPASHQRIPYRLLDCLDISQDVLIPESQDAEPLSFQPCRPVCIRCDLFRMLASIYFDNQSLLKTYKINDVRAQWLLPPELLSLQLSEANVLPQ